MCHKNRGPRCSTCHKPAPRHRCRCPAKHASVQTATAPHDAPPTYAAMIDPQPPTTTLLPSSLQTRCGSNSCGGHGYGGCGHRRRHCRGPVSLLVSLVIRKVQEKKERERLAAVLINEGEGEGQERGVIEAADEKAMEMNKEGKDEDVKVLTKSVRSMSL
ncbi:hypothetical protein IMSHALPRED_006482 [Imshaugia aleurites]|uniref:Uncharacterized protein n=1 Tax=Imshaugia aleurites TaxID=172621 RepID=A0A8H3FLB6_9LECA|nr:hypothetical protein IMSHALPRED_006482 [Imshaugia aleurites]